MLYAAYVYLTNSALISNVVDLSLPTILDWKKLSNPGATIYHYEGWLFMKTLPTTKKVIFSKDSTPNFALCLSGSTLTIENEGTLANGSLTGSPKVIMHITDSFPQQKWVYFVINVNNKVLETYLNGKLVQTLQLTTAIPNSNRGSLTLGGSDWVGKNGFITLFKRDPTSLIPDVVWKNYLNGNGLSKFTNWLNGYNASFSIYTSTEEVKKYSVF